MTDRVGLLLGLDLTEVGRIADALERHGERFLARVFREGEILRSRRHPRAFAEHVAGRFAAKEAAMKALGTGWSGGIGFRDVEVGRDAGGAPTLALAGVAAERAKELGVARLHVSLTHTRDHAQAIVVLER